MNKIQLMRKEGNKERLMVKSHVEKQECCCWGAQHAQLSMFTFTFWFCEYFIWFIKDVCATERSCKNWNCTDASAMEFWNILASEVKAGQHKA